MKIDEKPPEPDIEGAASVSALLSLEAENSNLRRLVVDLLEKNQQLREQVRVLTSGRNPEMPGELAASAPVRRGETERGENDRRGVDPRAA